MYRDDKNVGVVSTDILETQHENIQDSPDNTTEKCHWSEKVSMDDTGPTYCISTDEIVAEANRLADVPLSDETEKVFRVHNMREWLKIASSTSPPRKLLGDFWTEHELSILFADTGIGKSALAMQIATCLCNGTPFPGLVSEVPPLSVLYFDFELTEAQLQNRYAVKCSQDGRLSFVDHYEFPPNFYRVELNPSCRLFEDFQNWEKLIIDQIEAQILDLNVKVIFVDNLTYLSHETDKGKSALPLMQRLNDLKKRYGLTMMVLAHTPKRDDSRPLSLNDLAGSRILSNFCDSLFAMGRSQQEPNLRYLKQLKARNTELIHNAENVAILNFEKRYNFLGFEYVGCGSEMDHLQETSESRLEVMRTVKSLYSEGMSQRKIAEQVGISPATVNRYLKKL
jgi:predicted ATP-dependent serine protease